MNLFLLQLSQAFLWRVYLRSFKMKINVGNLYPDSGVELSKFSAKNYDKIMNIASFGKYKGFIKKAISDLNIKENDKRTINKN